MKQATERKVNEIAARAHDLESCYKRELLALKSKTASDEDRLVPRVSGIVIREGRWLLKIAQKFIDRHDIKLTDQQAKIIDEATEFFDDLGDSHSDEVMKNDFIYRVRAEFILHLKRLSGLIIAFDTSVKAQIAQIAMEEGGDDAEIEEEINNEMIG